MAPVSIIGALVALAIPTIAERMGQGAHAVQWIGWFAILALPITALIVATTPEPIAPEVAMKRSVPWADYWDLVRKPSFLRLLVGEAFLVMGPGWMSALYVFFFTHSRGFSVGESSALLGVYVVAGLIGAPAAAAVAMRFGKHRTLIATTTAYSLGLCTVLLLPQGNFLAAMPTMLWCGFMAAGFGLMTSAMTADFGDEIRLEQGKERITMIYSFTGLMAKLAAAMAGYFTYKVLDMVGFNPAHGVVNTPAAIHGLEMAFIIGPIVFVMLGGACFMGWNLSAARHADIRAQLDERDARHSEPVILESLIGDQT